MEEIPKGLKQSSAYHLYKAKREKDIDPVSINDYVFKYVRIMPFRDIIAQISKENSYLLPKDSFMGKVTDAWKLYTKLREEEIANG